MQGDDFTAEDVEYLRELLESPETIGRPELRRIAAALLQFIEQEGIEGSRRVH